MTPSMDMRNVQTLIALLHLHEVSFLWTGAWVTVTGEPNGEGEGRGRVKDEIWEGIVRTKGHLGVI